MNSSNIIRIVLFFILLNLRIKRVAPVKCYVCEFNRYSCPTLGGCPSNRDRCSVRHFNPWMVAQAECPTGCQTFLVTDPVGDIILWKRGCSNQLPTGSQSNICTTEYVHGSYRIDSCVCNRFLCNGTPRPPGAEQMVTGYISTVLIAFVIKFTTDHWSH